MELSGHQGAGAVPASSPGLLEQGGHTYAMLVLDTTADQIGSRRGCPVPSKLILGEGEPWPCLPAERQAGSTGQHEGSRRPLTGRCPPCSGRGGSPDLPGPLPQKTCPVNRPIVLLLKVLAQLRDHSTLLKVSSMLQRTPDQGKKYLRDADRQVLAQRAFILTVKVLEDTLSELAEGSERPGPKACSLPGARMTSDISHKASPEDGQEGLPNAKKPPLADGSGPGPEPGGKGGSLNHRPVAMDAGDSTDQAGERKDKESPRAGPTEPMDVGEAAARCSDLERTPSLLPGRPPRDRGPESRPAELSLEELSISARQQPTTLTPAQPVPTPAPATPPATGTRAGSHPEEPPPRPSRKRKLLEDTESGKTLLLDAYRVWQQGQKGVAHDLGRIERVMSETYMLIKQVDEEAALEQAVKFCQVHLGAAAQRQASGDTPTTPKHPKDSRENFFPAAAVPTAPDPVPADALQ
ncbi:calcineurin-binding protein cabin-1-like [Tupaia chinensis]|uniref:calcineurin-binding protein cabin-1-like n=1 Tax=Tupaia chinensis TaxID=246437 RepID=UPI0003C921A1|nr:calcineurin-binding protein cabin-1-like [Tupaia chinensis]